MNALRSRTVMTSVFCTNSCRQSVGTDVWSTIGANGDSMILIIHAPHERVHLGVRSPEWVSGRLVGSRLATTIQESSYERKRIPQTARGHDKGKSAHLSIARTTSLSLSTSTHARLCASRNATSYLALDRNLRPVRGVLKDAA